MGRRGEQNNQKSIDFFHPANINVQEKGLGGIFYYAYNKDPENPIPTVKALTVVLTGRIRSWSFISCAWNVLEVLC